MLRFDTNLIITGDALLTIQTTKNMSTCVKQVVNGYASAHVSACNRSTRAHGEVLTRTAAMDDGYGGEEEGDRDLRSHGNTYVLVQHSVLTVQISKNGSTWV